MDIPHLRQFHEHGQKPLLTVTKNMPVLDVIHQMSQAQTSYALILEEQKLLDIFTEKDVVQPMSDDQQLSVFANQTTLADITVAEFMTQPVITLNQRDAENLSNVVQLFRQHDIDHLPILDSQGQVINVVTWREVMERLCPTLDAKTAELAQAAAQKQQMAELLAQKEASYQASQARINHILDSAIAGTNEAIWDFDITTNQTFRSDRWYEMLGYEPGELSNLDDEWSIRIHPDDYDQVIAAQHAYLQRQVPDYNVEYRLRRKDGSYGWFRSRAKAIWDEQGNPVRLVGSLADITERKQMETALTESEAQYRLLFESNPHPMWIFDAETLSFLAVNRAATHKYGHSEAEFLSMKVKDIRPREEIANFQRAVSDFSLFSGSIYVGETKHCLQDGTVIDVEINGHPIAWAGKPARFILAKDITEHKQAELALQEREAMLRRIGDNLPNGAIYKVIREFDGSDRFSYLSAGFNTLMEVNPEDAIRDPSLLYRQFMPEDIPRLQAVLAESMANLSVFDMQLPIRTPSGQLKWLHFRSTPRQLEDGRFAWDGLVVDVTNIKHTEETLRRSEASLAESQRVARLGSWDFDMATSKITWSKELFRLFNRDPDQGEPNYEEHFHLYHPEDQEKLHQSIERTIATGESYKLILRVLQPDGSHRYMEAIGHVEFNTNGQVIRLYGTAQDVSDRIESEEKLKQAELRYRTLVEQIPGVVYTSPITPTSEFSYISPQIQKMLKIPPEHWNAGLFNSWVEYVHPEDRDRVINSVQNAIANGEPVNLEYRLFTADGEMIWVQDQATLVLAADGKTPILQGVAFDISDRKIAEQTLHTQPL